MTRDPAMANLDDCGCCEGISAETPVPAFNRPGLDAISRRVGDYARFRESMVAALSRSEYPSLRALKTREPDDFTIALLDAWAVAGDILTFYQERINNESYLRTATERLSLVELARLIGYRLAPGVAASVDLAFTMETAPGAPAEAAIPAGTKVQSIPGPGETPQTFETAAGFTARGAWNALRPRLGAPVSLSPTMETVTLDTMAANVEPGDRVLIVAGTGTTQRALRTILRVVKDAEASATRLEFVTAPSAVLTAETSPPTGDVAAVPSGPLSDAVVQAHILGKSWKEEDLRALAEREGWSLDALAESVNTLVAGRGVAEGQGVFAFRARAALFGHNAPDWNSLPATQRKAQWVEVRKPDGTWDKLEKLEPAFPTDWANQTVAQDSALAASTVPDTKPRVFLDATYTGIAAGSWIALEDPNAATSLSYPVEGVADVSRSAYAISAKVTRVLLPDSAAVGSLLLRRTSVLLKSEALPVAPTRLASPVSGSSLTLESYVPGLAAGQRVAVSGERADMAGVTATEAVTLKAVWLVDGRTRLDLATALAYAYVRDSVLLNANVAPATHGETKQEVLGSGDSGKPFQAFTLKQPPLTYVAGKSVGGADPTLQVRVNDILWHEADALYGRGPRDRVFTTCIGDDGKATVRFGDGVNGARPPSGVENIKATYRTGIGRAGQVKAGQLSLLATRPLGVQAVTNPLPAAGAKDPETRDQARGNAPLTVLTLDRVVSLRDYEDFSAAYAGIGKALATWTWFGQRRGVFLTVAGEVGDEIADDSPTRVNLIDALRRYGDPRVPVVVKTFRRRLFTIGLKVKVDSDFETAGVLSAVEAALRAHFAFERRAFGQAVTISEVMAAAHTVPGLIAVDVDALFRTGEAAVPNAEILAALPDPTDSPVSAAELLMLDAGRFHTLEAMP